MMSDSTMLIQLTAQAEAHGADLLTLRALIEEACELGAARALRSLGLEDDRARKDLDEMRELLSAWREAKGAAGRALIGWLVRCALVLLVVGMAVKFGLGGTKCASLLPALPIQSRPSNASSTPGEEYCRLRRSIYGPTCWQMAILK